MTRATWRWHIHRTLVDRLQVPPPLSPIRNHHRILFLSERGPICQAQLFPFFLYSRNFIKQSNVTVCELPLDQFLKGFNPYRAAVDVIALQTWFNLTPQELTDIAERIKSTWPEAKIAYFDWFAPLDLRYAETLNPHISAYVKKQVFRDFAEYATETLGDTNLTDHYAKRFGLNLPKTQFQVPSDFAQKLVLGSGFEYSPAIRRLVKRKPCQEYRAIDLHARVAARGSEWYTRMREEAHQKAGMLQGPFKVAHSGRITYSRYIEELCSSKLCLSPFGYGEICWRDFEAMATGALLLKPDVSHLQTANDFFRPYETYVPLRWDLSDLGEKVSHYVRNDDERDAMARNAYDHLADLYRRKQFLTDAKPLLKLLHLDESA